MWIKKLRTFFQLAGCLTVGLLAVYGLLMVFSSGSPAWAAIGQAIPNSHDPRVPNVLTYQGILRQPDGTPLEGTYEMTFRLYDSPIGGGLKHTEVISNVVVRDGLFTVLLGDTVPIDPAAFKGPLYISVQVGALAEMAPRQRIAPVAYAVQLTDGVYVDENGNVGIGTTDPQSQLDVNGNAAVGGNLSVNANTVVGGNLSVNADITSSGAINSGGDISWGGHLNNMIVKEVEYFAACYQGYPDRPPSTGPVTMVPASNSICFLTRVTIQDLHNDDGTGTCAIHLQDGNWMLVPSCQYPDADAECSARCLQW